MDITIIQGDDWTAIYQDGEKIDEGHSFTLARGLNSLGIDFTHRWVVEDEDDPESSFPDTL